MRYVLSILGLALYIVGNIAYERSIFAHAHVNGTSGIGLVEVYAIK